MAKSQRQIVKSESDNILSKLEDEIAQENPDIFKDIPADKKRNLLVAVKKTITKIHSGPLPDPETLAEYNLAIPNAAERIFTEFEEQGKHRRTLEEYAIKHQFRQSNRGQNFAFVITMSFLLTSGILIYLKHDWAGGTLGIGSLTGVVAVFIKGKDYQQKNLSEKKPE